MCASVCVRVYPVRRAGILGACNLRVKLQLLSKKATVLATPNTHDTQTTTHTDTNPHTTTNKGTKRGGGGRGAAAQAAPSAPVASAWCGALGSRGLSLLDVSVGALVRGVEDEDWRVRGAAASALVAASACELLTLRNGDAVPPNDGAGAEDTGKGTSGMTEGTGGSSGGGGGGGGGVNGGDMASRRQVVAQCVECLCDLTQVRVCVCVCMCVTHHACILAQLHSLLSLHTCLNLIMVCVCVYVCVCMCVYVCVYVCCRTKQLLCVYQLFKA